ncbi:substrate-binding domain-containing protein [Aquabacterium sp. A7-Y]|uniref:LacI family DNA-binding transcriptional regulator n=1 Tax=Aquabacterium sp. A7-Y TaxID=1349605 RepID=UPI00223DDDFE|nr:substrate-binding domain-containing protein [Aquabacterium sp. A7-Y]MCW7541625.1 substrate-binding domain-containing protein [Aquabacterium sp. A7-Y]
MSKTKRVSVRDVAEAAGVTIGSVSRVLNGGRYVSAELKAKVLAAAERLQYQPHAGARSLRLGRSQAIGCMVSDIENPLQAGFVAAVEAHVGQHGYTLLLANSHHSRRREAEILEMFERRGMDGAVVTSSFTWSEDRPNPYLDCGLPLVMVDRDGALTGDQVRMAHREGIAQAVRYLHSLGHRRIALFTAGPGLRPTDERVAGYREAHARLGLEVDERLLRLASAPGVSGADDMRALLALEAPPTALISLGSRLLSGALQALREARLRVPQDLSVVAISSASLLELADPPLTYVHFNLEQAGRGAAQLLLQRLGDGQDEPPQTLEIPMELVVRESCAAPRG